VAVIGLQRNGKQLTPLL